MTLYFYKNIFFCLSRKTTFHNKNLKTRENIFIFKKNMSILRDTSKIAYFSHFF